MRQERNGRIIHKTRVNLRLLLVDIEAAREHFSLVEGFHERSFVDDGAAGGVDDDDGGFHDGELGGGDHVVG